MNKMLFLLFNKVTGSLLNKNLGKIPGLIYSHDKIYDLINPHDLILVHTPQCKLYVNSDDKGVAPSLFKKGVYNTYQTDLFKKFIRKDTILLDIGANVGYFTLIAAGIIEDGKVYSFEPENNNYEILLKNIELNGFKNIVPLRKAVSNSNGVTKLFKDKKNFGCHSLSKGNVHENNGFIEVETIALDSFLEKINFDHNRSNSNESNIFVKLDVQGFESFVLEGAENLLKQSNIVMMMEFWPEGIKNTGKDPLKLLNQIKSSGFQINVIDLENKKLLSLPIPEILEYCDCAGGELNLLLKNNDNYDIQV